MSRIDGKTIADELIEAADPFRRVIGINAPFLNAGDDKPLREFIPGVWPTWGEFKRLMTAISVIDEARKNQQRGDVNGKPVAGNLGPRRVIRP